MAGVLILKKQTQQKQTEPCLSLQMKEPLSGRIIKEFKNENFFVVSHNAK